MPSFGRGDRVTFTGEFAVELMGVAGIVLRRRISNGHYVYDIKLKTSISSTSILGIPGITLSARGVLRNIPGSWIDLIH